jgi:lysyl-tRNA synthetase class I
MSAVHIVQLDGRKLCESKDVLRELERDWDPFAVNCERCLTVNSDQIEQWIVKPMRVKQ